MDERLIIRFWEVDLLRGLAVVMMMLFHFVFDLSYFGIYSIDVYSGFWLYFAGLTSSLFLLLVGVSLILSYWRRKNEGQAGRFHVRLLKRGFWILSLAIGVTLLTYLIIGKGYIIFGILHLIGLSIIIVYPFLNLKQLNFILGSFFVLIGLYLRGKSFDSFWLLWLGLIPRDLYTLDYFPIFPWFGIILIGLAFGDCQFRGYRRRMELPDLSSILVVRLFAFLGRNSLAIYLIHQPVMISFLYFSGVVTL